MSTIVTKSKEEMAREMALIMSNPIYFLRYVKIQEPGELSLPYELWPHLIKFFKSLETYKLNILVKSKQIGISWALAARCLHRLYSQRGANILELSSGDKEARKLLNKSRIIYHNLPDWMKIYTLEPDSGEQFGFKEIRSLVTALPSTEKAGIGETSDWVIHDEAEFHDYFEVNLGHTLATVSDSPDRQLTVVSTVDKTKPDSKFKQLYKSAQDGLNDFHPIFFGYDSRPNRDENWLEQQKRVNEATPWVVEANFPRTVEEALSPQAPQSCFNKDKLNTLWGSCRTPEVRQGNIYILHPPKVGTQYVGGVDVGEGLGLDYSCFTIIGRYGLESEVCAVIYTNTLGTAEFAYDVDKLGREYLNALVCVDNIGLGRAVVDKLVQLGYPKLYYSDKKRQKVGWALTRPNKRELVVKLVETINDGSLISRFKPQVKELMEYQWVNGYPEPTGKTHGDTVISLMLANQMLSVLGRAGERKIHIQYI